MSAAPPPLAFKFIEFNLRRALRGAEAARVEVSDHVGNSDLLWMSPKDIRANIREYGAHPELEKALAAYRGKA